MRAARLLPLLCAVGAALSSCVWEGDTAWTLRQSAVFSTAYDWSVCSYQRRAFDGRRFYFPSERGLSIFGPDGKLEASVDIRSSCAGLGIAAEAFETHWVHLSQGRIFMAVGDQAWQSKTYGLICIDGTSHQPLWASRLSDGRGSSYAMAPAEWNGHIVTCVDEGGESCRVRLTRLDSADGSFAMERCFPVDAVSYASLPTLGDRLWLACSRQDLYRIDLERFLDTSAEDAQCLDYAIPIVDVSLARSEGHCYLDESRYFLQANGRVECRNRLDDGVVWHLNDPVSGADFAHSAPWLLWTDRLFIPDQLGRIYCVKAETGALLWSATTWPDGADRNDTGSLGCVIEEKWYAQYSETHSTITIFDIATGERLLMFQGQEGDIAYTNLWAVGNRLYHANEAVFTAYDITDPRVARTWLLVALWAGGSGGAGLLAFLAYRFVKRSKRRKDREGGLGDRACVGEQEKAREEPITTPLAMAALR